MRCARIQEHLQRRKDAAPRPAATLNRSLRRSVKWASVIDSRRIRSVLQDSQNQPGSQQWVHPRIHTPHIDRLRPTTPPPHPGSLSKWTAGAPGRRLSSE